MRVPVMFSRRQETGSWRETDVEGRSFFLRNRLVTMRWISGGWLEDSAERMVSSRVRGVFLEAPGALMRVVNSCLRMGSSRQVSGAVGLRANHDRRPLPRRSDWQAPQALWFRESLALQ